jgi:hypothetical protein
MPSISACMILFCDGASSFPFPDNFWSHTRVKAAPTAKTKGAKSLISQKKWVCGNMIRAGENLITANPLLPCISTSQQALYCTVQSTVKHWLLQLVFFFFLRLSKFL